MAQSDDKDALRRRVQTRVFAASALLVVSGLVARGYGAGTLAYVLVGAGAALALGFLIGAARKRRRP